jgi:hypothetical protein
MREWLNAKEGLAAIQWEANEASVEFSITDCNRKISLEFYIWDEESRRKAEYKLEVLERNVWQFTRELRKQIKKKDAAFRKNGKE